MLPQPVSTKTPEKYARWAIIYPIYINKNKTMAQGRKMALTKSVDNPTLQEIFQACQALNFKCVAEPNKLYSRDALFEIGRLRVQMKDEATLEYVNAEVGNNRRKLLALISAHINAIPGRKAPKSLEQEIIGHVSQPLTKGKVGKGAKK
jgi:signal recognition particle subunit SRP19